MRVLLVKPLEAPVFSRTPITSHEFIVGVHRAQPIPSPTTIAGMLGSALGLTLGGRANTHTGVIKALLAELEEKFSCRRPIVKGPFIWFRGLSEEPYVCLGDIFIKLRVIDKMVAEIEAGRREGEVKCIDCVKSSIERRVGVRLKRGYNDAVEKV
ncbi:MAG: CRISPR-associated protein Cas5, partial [Acidilobaceae archaeon]